MGEARRRQLAGNTKPEWPKNKTAKWKLHTPSKFIRWISENTGPNRAERRKKNSPISG